MTIAVPYRILWIFVDPRRAACDVIVSIGHELWHTVEVLSEPSIRSDGGFVFLPHQGLRAGSARVDGNRGRYQGGTGREERAS